MNTCLILRCVILNIGYLLHCAMLSTEEKLDGLIQSVALLVENQKTHQRNLDDKLKKPGNGHHHCPSRCDQAGPQESQM